MSGEAISLKRKLRLAVKKIEEQNEVIEKSNKEILEAKAEIEKFKLDIVVIREEKILAQTNMDAQILTLTNEIEGLKTKVTELEKPKGKDEIPVPTEPI